MEIKEYLIETFKFNDSMNKQMLNKIKELPDKEQCIKFFSHLINSQDKWLARIVEYPNNPNMDWWEPIYNLDGLETKWNDSLNKWIKYIEDRTEEDLLSEVKFVGYDGGHWSAILKDIPLQLNYHSIHHRAQMQLFIRQQGLEPDFIDYIGTKYKKLS